MVIQYDMTVYTMLHN